MAATELGGDGGYGGLGQMGLGFGGDGGKVERADKDECGRTRAAWHPKMASTCPGDGWRRCRHMRVAAEQGGGEGEADGWARPRKMNGSSLKFKTKVFPGSKIHQIFTRDR